MNLVTPQEAKMAGDFVCLSVRRSPNFKHDRDALRQNVFRKLELHFANRGFQFQAIDLRWGVPMEAALDHRTMQICFEELRRSQQISPQPSFLFCSAIAGLATASLTPTASLHSISLLLIIVGRKLANAPR